MRYGILNTIKDCNKYIEYEYLPIFAINFATFPEGTGEKLSYHKINTAYAKPSMVGMKTQIIDVVKSE